MSLGVTFIFPNQLYQNHPAIDSNRQIYLIEEHLYFKQYVFHKQKLVLHRASMKFFAHWVQSHGFPIHYIDTSKQESDVTELIKKLSKEGVTDIHFVDVVDNWLLKKMQNTCLKYHLQMHVYESPNFLNTINGVAPFFSQRKTYFQTDFYTWQRKQRTILLEEDGKPVGGKWTFDSENRAKFPKNEVIPTIAMPEDNAYLAEARTYVDQYFPNNYGSVKDAHLFAINYKDAENWLKDFMQNRFEKFGIYEDAIVANEKVLHHAVLSPMLNIGLLQPQQIIDCAIEIGTKNNIPLNSLEGFIRQIMGWREFIRIVYEREGSKQRTKNYWNFTRKIPPSFWKGNTGIPPIDITIKKILATGYCHHIERLMVLGNFMLLCEFDPNEVYRWFMEMFIDAYDWVMVPNVYGMTQFADGGIMTTKPYISGSNYLMKMSNYEKGSWQEIWDGLFWRFMHEHRSFFLKNPRLGMLIGTFDKMNEDKKQTHINNANSFLMQLDNQNKKG